MHLPRLPRALDVAELVPYQQMGYGAYRRLDLDAVPTRALTLIL